MPYHTIPTLRPEIDSRDNHQPIRVEPIARVQCTCNRPGCTGCRPAPTCPTCLNGCECTGPNPLNGCGHYGCWGPAATHDCPDVPAMSKLFGATA